MLCEVRNYVWMLCVGLSRQGASLYTDCCWVVANVHVVIVHDEVLDLCSTFIRQVRHVAAHECQSG